MAKRDSLPPQDRSELASSVAPTQSRGTPSFDVIIGGGGSAGAVMAKRPSSDPSRRTLLIEAGRSGRSDGYLEPVPRHDLLGLDAELGRALRAVDASIWPDLPSVATALPTLMLAERIAAGMAWRPS